MAKKIEIVIHKTPVRVWVLDKWSVPVIMTEIVELEEDYSTAAEFKKYFKASDVMVSAIHCTSAEADFYLKPRK